MTRPEVTEADLLAAAAIVSDAGTLYPKPVSATRSIAQAIADTRAETERLIEENAADATVVRRMLELGDTRLSASEGPAGGQLPDLTPEEWGRVYRACKRIATRSGSYKEKTDAD